MSELLLYLIRCKKWFPCFFYTLHISLIVRDKGLSEARPQGNQSHMTSALMTLVRFIAWYDLSHSPTVQTGRKEFILLCCDLANLPAVIKQTFRGMYRWTIATLISSTWARRSQHPTKLVWSGSLCVMQRSLPLWTQYPLLLFDKRGIRMKLLHEI